MARRSDQPVAPMAVAMQWVGKIFAASLMMVLPGLGGQWLDEQFGTGFLAIVGFVLGLVGGMTYLIAATRQAEANRKSARVESRRTTGGEANGGNERLED